MQRNNPTPVREAEHGRRAENVKLAPPHHLHSTSRCSLHLPRLYHYQLTACAVTAQAAAMGKKHAGSGGGGWFVAVRKVFRPSSSSSSSVTSSKDKDKDATQNEKKVSFPPTRARVLAR